MIRPPLALLLVAAALACAPEALAASRAQAATVELDATSDGLFVARGETPRFTLAGVHWQGPGRVLFRTRAPGGRWSAWRPAAPEDEDRPDEGSAEDRRRWRIGNPWWTGPSTVIQARALGRVSRIRAHVVWSPESLVPYRVPAAAEQPAILPRASWGANESIRRAPPVYAPAARLAIVHHTAGSNGYSRTEAPAIVRGIQLYHVRGNGWNDIGYNFLVDRFGTVYEGRFGGIERNVVGAHALGFNSGSVGIALLGTYGGTRPSAAAQAALARLLAWRLDVAHVDPLGAVTFVSGGSERFAAGLPVVLRAVSGHRDTGATECPGSSLYARLGSLAATARGLGGAKIFDPDASVSGTAVRFTAGLSRPQPWTVSVLRSGAEVARGAGTGPAVDWTWDSAGAAAGSYTWTISSGAARPASGSVRAGGGSLPLAVQEAVLEPEAISPNGDLQADSTVLGFRLSTAANLTVEVADVEGGVVAAPVDRVWTRAGEHEVEIGGDDLPDGRYGVIVTAHTAAGGFAQTAVPLTVSRTLGTVRALPAAFSPNGDGRRDDLSIEFALTAPAEVRIRVLREGRWVASPLVAAFQPGVHRFVWTGSRGTGMVRDGAYEAAVEASDDLGAISYAVPFAVDTVAPRVRILPGPRLRVEVSEPSILTLLVDGKPLRRQVQRAGIVRIPWRGPAARVRAVAWDGAGNRSAPAVRVAGAR
jgi:hypothetical protein